MLSMTSCVFKHSTHKKKKKTVRNRNWAKKQCILQLFAQQVSMSTTYTSEQRGSESQEQTLQAVKEVRATIKSQLLRQLELR